MILRKMREMQDEEGKSKPKLKTFSLKKEKYQEKKELARYCSVVLGI